MKTIKKSNSSNIRLNNYHASCHVLYKSTSCMSRNYDTCAARLTGARNSFIDRLTISYEFINSDNRNTIIKGWRYARESFSRCDFNTQRTISL